MLVIEDGPLDTKLLRRELIMGKKIKTYFHSAAEINTAPTLVQKSARCIHSFHNPTKKTWNVNLWGKDILQVLFQCSSGDSEVTIVTMHWSAEDPGKIFGGGKRYLSSPKISVVSKAFRLSQGSPSLHLNGYLGGGGS